MGEMLNREIVQKEGVDGLRQLPGIGESLARAIHDLVHTGRLPMLERLRGEMDPVAVLTSVPGIGPQLAARLHHDLAIDTLECSKSNLLQACGAARAWSRSSCFLAISPQPLVGQGMRGASWSATVCGFVAPLARTSSQRHRQRDDVGYAAQKYPLRLARDTELARASKALKTGLLSTAPPRWHRPC